MISNHITGYNERVGNAGTIYSKQNTSCGRGAWLFIIIEMWLLSTGVQCFQWIAEPSNHTITESGKNVSISWRYVLENGEQPISSKIYNDGEKTITIATMNILKKKYLLNEEYDGAAKAISENSTVTLEFFFIKKNLADKEFCIHMAISVYRATKEFSKEYRSCTKLSVYVHPRIVYHSHNIIKPNGSTVELKCNATGDPEPSITWTKVTNNSVLTNSSLMTVNITQQAFGEYCCIADNKYANDTYCITIGDPLLSNTAPTNYTMINNSVTIICLATGIPIPTIEWTNLSGNIIHQSKDGNYTIPFKQCKNETWTYYCRAWSITGKTPNKKISVYVNTMMQHCKQTSTDILGLKSDKIDVALVIVIVCVIAVVLVGLVLILILNKKRKRKKKELKSEDVPSYEKQSQHPPERSGPLVTEENPYGEPIDAIPYQIKPKNQHNSSEEADLMRNEEKAASASDDDNTLYAHVLNSRSPKKSVNRFGKKKKAEGPAQVSLMPIYEEVPAKTKVTKA